MSKKYTYSTVDCVFNKESGKFLDTDIDLLKSDINDVKNKINKTSFFYSFDSIGLNEGSETIIKIAENLPQYSTLLYHKVTNSGNNEIYPKETGFLSVTKATNPNRVKFEFSTISDTWIGFYDRANVNPMWSGWKKLVTGEGRVNTLNIEDLNVDSDCRIEDIIKALPDNSQLYYPTSSSEYSNLISQLPKEAGVLFIYKGRTSRTVLEFTQSQNGHEDPQQTVKYIGSYDSVSNSISPWCGIYQGSGLSSDRPKEPNRFIGMQYFDTSLNKPIWWNGSKWVDANGTSI